MVDDGKDSAHNQGDNDDSQKNADPADSGLLGLAGFPFNYFQ
jgi:hypothetical protein